MKKINWKPMFKGLGVQVFHGENGISLHVYGRFFLVRLPLSTGASAKLRAGMELAERQSNLGDWQKKHNVKRVTRNLPPLHLN